MIFVKCIFILLFLSSLTWANYNDYYNNLEESIIQKNPLIIMQKYKSLAAKNKQFADFMLPDVDTEYMIMTTGFQLTVSQMIPFPTKIYAKSKLLNKNYQAGREEYNLISSQVKSEFKFYYLSLYFIANKIKILDDNSAIMEQLESQINSQVVSGKISTSKLLFIQIEKEKIKDSIQRTKTKKQNITQTIVAIFDNKIKSQDLINSIKTTSFTEYDINLSEEELKLLIKESSIYKKKKYQKAQVEYMKQLKYNKFFPDIMLETSYKKMSDASTGMSSTAGFTDNLQIMFNLQVPITVFKRKGELSEMGNLLHAQSSALKNIYNNVEKNILNTKDHYIMNKTSYNTYKTTLKETAEQNFIEMQSKYATSKMSAVDFLEAFRKLLSIDLMILKYQVEMEKDIIMLEKITTKNILELRKYFKK